MTAQFISQLLFFTNNQNRTDRLNPKIKIIVKHNTTDKKTITQIETGENIPVTLRPLGIVFALMALIVVIIIIEVIGRIRIISSFMILTFVVCLLFILSLTLHVKTLVRYGILHLSLVEASKSKENITF